MYNAITLEQPFIRKLFAFAESKNVNVVESPSIVFEDGLPTYGEDQEPIV